MNDGGDAVKRTGANGAPSPAGLAAPAEQRVSEIRGDRLCERCGFNLCGQMVLREGHYGLLIARCPECGQVAPMQEYPRRSKWARRVVAVAAAALVLLFAGMTIAIAAGAYGVARGVADVAARPLGAEIGVRFFDHVVQKMRQEPLPAQWTQAEQAGWFHVLQVVSPAAVNSFTWGAAGPPPEEVVLATEQQIALARQRVAAQGWWGWIDESWWQSQNRSAVRRAAGGGLRELPVEVWLATFAVALALGVGLAVAQAHRRRLGLALWTLAPVGLALAAGVMWPPSVSVQAWGWGGWTGTVMAHGLAQRALWPVALWTTLAVVLAGLLAGAMIGRPVARLALRAILPPRLVGAFGVLWLCDGLPPPRGAASVSRGSQ